MNTPNCARSVDPAADPLEHLSEALFRPMGVDGVYARTALYDARRSSGSKPTSPSCASREAEIMRFPPVMSRAQLEKSGYLKSFPNLLGCVCALHGTEA